MSPSGRARFARAAVCTDRSTRRKLQGRPVSEQFLAPVLQPQDDEVERSLRPRCFDEFVGQVRVKEQLAIALEAARTRGEALDHVLLVGPPGLGKTSLAYILREELGVGIRTVAGPALERKGDLAAILTALEARDVLFVDEIHRLSAAVEEVLYPALEDFRLDIIVGQGVAARTLTLDLPPFTLVGATTRTGLPTTRQKRSPGAPAGHRELRTGSCAGCGTWPRCGTKESSPRLSPRRRSSSSRSTSAGWSAPTGSCCARSSSASTAARSGCRRWRWRWARRRTPSRTSTSRTYSNSASSSARLAAASSPSAGEHTSARSPRRPTRRCSSQVSTGVLRSRFAAATLTSCPM